MARRPKAVVLDSWAVLAYLEDERAGPQVGEIIATAHERDVSLLMTTVNAGEVWCIVAREVSDAAAERAIADLNQLGIEFVDADWALARVAAGFKARHRMSYADCFAAALARDRKAELVTGDPEFRQIEGDVRIAWLVPHKG
ncbi:MAG: PIN domain-containing protein [Acidiferrobacteraceae bacterium]